MYDELIESLRYEAAFAYLGSDGERLAWMMRKAADAIEELSREVEEYKVAYRKEHNKRIAENRYLYDELTKVIKEE